MNQESVSSLKNTQNHAMVEERSIIIVCVWGVKGKLIWKQLQNTKPNV